MQGGLLILAPELWDTAATEKKKNKSKTNQKKKITATHTKIYILFFKFFQATYVFCIFKEWSVDIEQVISQLLRQKKTEKKSDNTVNNAEILTTEIRKITF